MKGFIGFCATLTAAIGLVTGPAYAVVLLISSDNSGNNLIYRYNVGERGSVTLDTSFTGYMNAPTNMALSGDGELFVTNAVTDWFTRFSDPAGNARSNGISDQQLDAPVDLFFRNGDMYVLDEGVLKRYVFDLGGTASKLTQYSLGVATPGGTDGAGSHALFLAPWGELLVTHNKDRIDRYAFDGGGAISYLGDISDTALNNGLQMAYYDGELFVANNDSNGILRYLINGYGSWTPNGYIASIQSPFDLAFSPWGELYVTSDHFSTDDLITVFGFSESGEVAWSESFTLPDGASANGLLFLTAVPEPAHVGLGFAVASLAFVAWRRRKPFWGISPRARRIGDRVGSSAKRSRR